MDAKSQIKNSLSILDVVSTYIKLEKSGSQYKARCPFHNEKTPSFYISPDRGIYKCFGCGESGDIFSFVEKIESVPFYEALTILANRSGIKLEKFNQEKKDKEDALISILEKSKNHFRENLEKSIEAKKYLIERGLTPEIIQKFEIGFSVGGEIWRDLFIFLYKEGYQEKDMVRSGLILKKENEEKYFDRFRGRIMFPIKNTFGNVVGFSARILPIYDDKKSGKYINSPETEIYHKSKILFGYNFAKKSIAEKKEVFIVEGQMDLIMSHQAGVENIVAVSGTALTEDHIKILKRFTEKVILSFDNDEAGEKAMLKSALLCLYGNLDVFILEKKDEIKDLADFILLKGQEEFLKHTENKKHIIEYLSDFIFAKNKDERERLKYLRIEILPFLRAMSSNIEKDFFIKYLAQKFKIEEKNILNDLLKIQIDFNLKENLEDKNLNLDKKILENKDKRIVEILAILKSKNILEKDFFKEYLEEEKIKEKIKIDFKNIFLENQKEIAEEELEKLINSEIILKEEHYKNNIYFKENPEKFIKDLLKDLSKNYKKEILNLEFKKLNQKNDKTKEDLEILIEIKKIVF